MDLRSEHLKLGKGAVFVKRDLLRLPLTDGEFEADFFLADGSLDHCEETWTGMVVETECGAILAMEDVRLPPPTVNDLARLLAYAMQRPLNGGDRQRLRSLFLRDRSQWQELLPHLRQLGIEVVLTEELPRFDEAVIEFMEEKGTCHTPRARDAVSEILKAPFPRRKRTSFDAAMALLQWTDGMLKAGYASARKGTPAAYDPLSIVTIHLTAREIAVILTKTEIAKTKTLRPRLEAIDAARQDVDLSVGDWGRVISSLCVPSQESPVSKQRMAIARRIASRLSDVLTLDTPLPSDQDGE